MKRCHFVLFFVFLSIVEAFSCSPAIRGEESYLIVGSVKDSTHNAIPYATVSLFIKQNFLAETHTDSRGDFELKINNNTEEPYRLVVTSVGYEKYEQEFTLSDSPQRFSIMLSEVAFGLNEVIIEGKPHAVKLRFDGYSINTKDLRATRNNLYDLLISLPKIYTKGDQLSVIGKRSVLVKINNTLLRVAETQLTQVLKGYDASLVDEVNVITEPPTRYNANGETALIVVKMASEFANYIGGNVAMEVLQAKYRHMYHPYSFFVYNRDKFSSFINVAYNYEVRKASSEILYNNQTNNRQDFSTEWNKINFPFLYAGMQYDYSKLGAIGVSVNASYETQNVRTTDSIRFETIIGGNVLDSLLFAEKNHFIPEVILVQ